MNEQAEQLDRNAMLMLYAADELSPAQRLAFDSQLARDAELSAELVRLREAMGRCDGALADLDERERLPVTTGVAVRRVERSMQQWVVDRLRAPAEEGTRHLRMPWWAYPTAVAAIVIVSFLVWSSRQEVKDVPPSPSARQDIMMAEAEELANRLDAEFAPTEVASDELPHAQSAAEELGTFFIPPREEQEW